MPIKDDSLGKPVVNGVLRYTSVSAIALFETCPAKYFFRYVLGRPGDESPSLTFGSGAHERLEKHQRGEPVELGPCERAVLPFIPPAGADEVLIEQALHKSEPLMLGTVPMVGWADRIELAGEAATVTDWKFKKDVAKWAAKPRALSDHRDTDGRQLLAAAQWVIQNFNGVDQVTPRHVTSQTGGIDDDGTPAGPFLAKETRGPALDRLGIENRWRDVTAQFEGPLLNVVKQRNVSHVAGNTKNCFKYGRSCPYIDECPHKTKGATPMTTSLIPAHGNSPTPRPADPPIATPEGVTLYFGASYPMFEQTSTLHVFRDMVERAVLRDLLGQKYQEDVHVDVRAVKHPNLEFGKWKAELAIMAKKLLPRLAPGHYLVNNEEKMLVVADALLPTVNAVGGPG